MRQTRGTAAIAVAALAMAGALIAAGPTSAISHSQDRHPRQATRPNIVVIMTDDQAVGDLKFMPRTRTLLAGRGVTFTNTVSANPLCCPARATLLTGQASQNNGVWTNDGKRGGYNALTPGQTRLPQWLQRAGYQSAMIGKHLNGYSPGADGRDPGWDYFDPTIQGVYSYTRFTQWANGRPTAHRGYITDYVASSTVAALAGFEHRDARPFFLWASYVAPHRSDRGCAADDPLCSSWPIPASRFASSFSAARPPSLAKASYNEADLSDKIWAYRDLPNVVTRRVVAEYRNRARTLASVDLAVARTVRALASRGELDHTVIMFVSDNGYVMGEHRWIGKVLPFEESLRVPLIIRGPGFAAGQRATQLVTTADLTATIVDLARSGHSHPLDGLSLVPYLTDPAASDRRPGTLIQSGGFGFAFPLGTWMYRGYRDPRYTYARYRGGAEELYDRLIDPLELTNLVGHPEYDAALTAARRHTRALVDCAGSTCRRVFPALPPPAATTRSRGTQPSHDARPIRTGPAFAWVPYVP